MLAVFYQQGRCTELNDRIQDASLRLLLECAYAFLCRCDEDFVCESHETGK